MNRRVSIAAAVVLLTGCEGFKDAMTAHVDVVARAGSQELSVTRLADLLGKSRAPVNPEVARAATDLWVNYQLAGLAAAKGDSLKDAKVVDDAMWSVISSSRSNKLYERISKSWVVADSNAAARYAQGEVLAAQHILLTASDSMTPAQKAVVRRKAESIRAQANAGNFAALATQHSQDPGSAARGGSLGVFKKGDMVPQFEKAILALEPGQISPVIETAFGYHVIRRSPYADVKSDVDRAANQSQFQRAESLYVANMETAGKIQVKPAAGGTLKAALKDPEGSKSNRTVIATSTAGDLTVGRTMRWIEAYPPQAQLPQQLAGAPDSLVAQFVKSVVRNELVLKQADSAKIQLDSSELSGIRRAFTTLLPSTWNGLGVAPRMLADSAKSENEKERLAGRRIDTYFEGLINGRAPFVEIPPQLATALRSSYEYKVNPAGLTRAVELATKVRAASDSAAKARQPASAVPMPGTQPPATAAPATPQP